jgi:hypothetical protein
MGAKAALAKIHRCSRCGETDSAEFTKNSSKPSGLSGICKACVHLIYKAKYVSVKGKKVDKRFHERVKVICGYCEEEFGLIPGVLKYRLDLAAKRKREPILYCSCSCAVFARAGKGISGLHMLKRHSNWSDEQWEWERKLVKLGLAMNRGCSGYLVYGHDYDGADDMTDAQSANRSARLNK